jgi:hypothetical protein
MVLASGGKNPDAGKSAWGSGFLPSVYQGVQCRSAGEPVLFIQNPDGVNADIRKASIDAINSVNEETFKEFGDPETVARIAQYEMAYKMQSSVPEVMDISKEPEYIHQLYGTKPGEEAFANNCLLARKMVEQGVRFVQLFDWGWDSHGTSKSGSVDYGLHQKCLETDRAISALLIDLEQRGLLDETLVVWGGEFGRTVYSQGTLTNNNYGRDHHGRCFSMWMAGGGTKGGIVHGETDEFGYNIARDPVHLHDWNATILHLMGVDHKRLTFRHQGRDFRLTDIAGELVKPILA